MQSVYNLYKVQKENSNDKYRLLISAEERPEYELELKDAGINAPIRYLWRARNTVLKTDSPWDFLKPQLLKNFFPYMELKFKQLPALRYDEVDYYE